MAITENEIVFNLFHNEEYARKVIPYVDVQHFSENFKPIYVEFKKFFTSYNAVPSIRIIESSLEDSSLTELQFNTIIQNLQSLSSNDYHTSWLVDNTEVFCRDVSIYNALTESISIADGKAKKPKEAIPALLSEAIAFSFDNKIGHDYLNDAEARYEYYQNGLSRIETDISVINLITRGGLPKKALTVLAASTGVGKSLIMCHFAKVLAERGYNVLYITLELSEEMIGERIDANMLDVPINDIRKLSKESFLKKIDFIKSRRPGRLIIKEYPTGGANVEHFRALLRELNIKKKFKPEILIIDYLTICSSSRYTKSETGSYFVGKAIAEEIRGLVVEQDAVGLTAVQFNRGGQNNSDSDLSNIAESSAIAMTSDLVLGMISTDDLRALNQILVKQLKNRFGDLNYYSKFMLGVDYGKMRIFELDPIDEGLPTQIKQTADHEIETLHKQFKEEGEKFNTAIKKSVNKFSGFS